MVFYCSGRHNSERWCDAPISGSAAVLRPSHTPYEQPSDRAPSSQFVPNVFKL